jgi:hypothetical protein
MSRRRQRSPAYRARRQRRQFGRHCFIEESLPEPYLAGGYRVTEYRRGRIVSFEHCPSTEEQNTCTPLC